MSNYYKILGVARNATRTDIRRAYLQKAKQYHPDLNKSPDSASKFKQIQEAYQTLYDQNARSQYDSTLNTKSQGHTYKRSNDSEYTTYSNYGNTWENFSDQFRAETENLHRQWHDMDQERLRKAAEKQFNFNVKIDMSNILTYILKSIAINLLFGHRFKFFIHFLLRMLPVMAMPLLFLYGLSNMFRSSGGARVKIVYDSYGRAYIVDSEGRRKRIPSLDKPI